MVDETSFIAPVTLAMEPHRNLGIRRLDEAEDPAGPSSIQNLRYFTPY
jgi:hypothetical protein